MSTSILGTDEWRRILRASPMPNPRALLTALLGSAPCVGAVGLLAVVAGLPALGALALGAVWGTLFGAPSRVGAWGSRLLKVGVVALGLGLDPAAALQTGCEGLVVALVTLAVALGVGFALTTRLGVGRDVGLLVTVGTAICGGSAIAAAAPALRARSSDVAVALAVVFLLNAVALAVFPLLGTALGMAPDRFGAWCALAIHDTSSVVGAAATAGDEALAVATVTKLVRSLWIVPVVCALARLPSLRAGAGDRAAGPRCPWFLVAFVAGVVLVAVCPALAPAGRLAARGGRELLILALFALGLGLRPAMLRAAGWRPFVLGIGLWGIVSAVALALV